MKLEEEIKQKSFSGERHKLVVNLIYTGNWMTAMTARALKPFGLSPQQYNALRILRGQAPNPASVNLIMERMLDKTSNVSRIVEKLRLKKLVERKECPSDRRQVEVNITRKGLGLLDTITSGMKSLEAGLDALTTSEARKLNELLDRLRG